LRKSPIYCEKIPMYCKKRPIYCEKSPVHREKRPVYEQKALHRALFAVPDWVGADTLSPFCPCAPQAPVCVCVRERTVFRVYHLFAYVHPKRLCVHVCVSEKRERKKVCIIFFAYVRPQRLCVHVCVCERERTRKSVYHLFCPCAPRSRVYVCACVCVCMCVRER